MQSRSQFWTPRISLFLSLDFVSIQHWRLGRSRPARTWIGEIARSGIRQPGNYLSALIASADRDTPAAEVYYREALRADPRNPDLLERAFAAALSNGDEPSASSLGERLLTRDPNKHARAACDRRSRYRARTICVRARPLGERRRDARARCDDGATYGLELCRTIRSSPRSRHARPYSRPVDPRISRLSRGPDCWSAGKLCRGPAEAKVRV